MVKLNVWDKDLIRAFVAREAKDYGINGAKDSDWIDNATVQIIKAIEKYPHAVSCKIRSMGNSGCIIRTLQLDLQNGDWDKMQTSYITICSCGRLEHLITSGIDKE